MGEGDLANSGGRKKITSIAVVSIEISMMSFSIYVLGFITNTTGASCKTTNF